MDAHPSDSNAIERWKIMWDVLFNSSPESIIILSETQTILDANDTTLKLLGKKKEEVVGKKCYEVFHQSSKPPEGCPFIEMKKRNWKPCVNEMETIIGDLIVSVVPLEIPGEERKILHFARDVTLINQLAQRLITSLQRYASFLNTLIKLDSFMLREKNIKTLLNNSAKIICENENFEASWILVKKGKNMRTLSKYGVDWNLEERYPGDIEEKDDLWSKRHKEGFFIFIPLKVEDTHMGLLVLLRKDSEELSEENKKILRIMADDIAITIKNRKLELSKKVAYRELEKNIKDFATLIDGIRNPLAVIMGIAEMMIDDEEIRKKITEQIEKIEEITYKIDKRWAKSENLRRFLKEE